MMLLQLPQRYKTMFKKELSPADFGFPKLKTLVEACEAHVGMREADNGHEWVFQVAGDSAGGKRPAAAAAEEPKAKKQKKKPEQPVAAAAPAAPPPNPEQVKLKFLEGREKKGLAMTAEQRRALAELRAKLGLEAPAPAPAPAAAISAGGADAASDRSGKRKPAVLDRLGVRPTAGAAADKRRRGSPAAVETQTVETASTTDDVFKAVASAGGEAGVGAASKAVVLAALRRFAELVQDTKLSASDYATTRGAVVHNKAFHLLLGSLGAAIVGAHASELADVFFALQALNYPRDKEFSEEPLLGKLVDGLLSARPGPYELSVAIWALAKLRVKRMGHPVLHALCDAVPRDDSLASLDGESVGKFFWALSARDDLGQKLFGEFQFPQLIRALLGECGDAFCTAPMEALMDVVSAYPVVGGAFEENQPTDMKSVSVFLGHLKARTAQLSADQLLILLRSLQDFPRSVACPAVGSLLSGVSDVVTEWSSTDAVSPIQLCRVAAAATLQLLGPVDEDAADLLLKTCATLLQPHLQALASEHLFDLCVTYVLPAVKGERTWAYPIFNRAADVWVGDASSTVLRDLPKDRLERLGEEFCKCRERPDTVIPSIRDIAAKIAGELHYRDSHLFPELKQFRWMEMARRQEPPSLQSEPRDQEARERSPPRSRFDQRGPERESARRGDEDRRAKPAGDVRDDRWQTTRDSSRRLPEHLDDRRGARRDVEDRRDMRQPIDQRRDRDMRDGARRGQDDRRADGRTSAAPSASGSGWDIGPRGSGSSETRPSDSNWDRPSAGDSGSMRGRDDRNIRRGSHGGDDVRRDWQDDNRRSGGIGQPRHNRERDRDDVTTIRRDDGGNNRRDYDVGRDEINRRNDRRGDGGRHGEERPRESRREDRLNRSRSRGRDSSRDRDQDWARERDNSRSSRDQYERHRGSGSDRGSADDRRARDRPGDNRSGGRDRSSGASGSGNPCELLLSYLDERVDESTLHNAFVSYGGSGGIRFIRLMREKGEALIIFGSEAAARAAAAATVGEFSLGHVKCMVTYMGSKQRPSAPAGHRGAVTQSETTTSIGDRTESSAGYKYDPDSGYYFHEASGE